MEKSDFWKFIDKSRKLSQDDREQQVQELSTLLHELSPEELVDFDRILSEYFHASYNWPLWGAAYIIGGGCSDDSFDYFRGWLISRGEKVFSESLANPDSLAKHIKEEDGEIDCQVEGYQSIALDIWSEKTGKEWSDFPQTTIFTPNSEPSGEKWEEEDLDTLFPKLTKKFNS